jgi:hypothetical protein
MTPEPTARVGTEVPPTEPSEQVELPLSLILVFGLPLVAMVLYFGMLFTRPRTVGYVEVPKGDGEPEPEGEGPAKAKPDAGQGDEPTP